MSIPVAILTIGDELLLGQIVDTNAVFIAQQLALLGFDVQFKCTVGDTEEKILSVFDYAFAQCSLVLITGGLGPTRDDLTKPLLAKWFHSPVSMHPEALKDLEALLEKRGRPINELTIKQAEHPVKADYIKNDIGTAPGIWLEEHGKIAVAMPGVPYEMKHMLTEKIIPRLREKFRLPPIQHRFVRTIGIPESNLAMKLESWETKLPSFIKLAYLPSGGQVKLRLTGRELDEQKLAEAIDFQVAEMLPLIHEFVYATSDIELEEVVAGLLSRNNVSVDLHDEISGGLFRNRLLLFPHIHLGKEDPNIFVELKSSQREISGNDYQFSVTLQSKDKQGKEVNYQQSKGLNKFLHPETNLNMICLTGFDLIRRCLLQAGY